MASSTLVLIGLQTPMFLTGAASTLKSALVVTSCVSCSSDCEGIWSGHGLSLDKTFEEATLPLAPLKLRRRSASKHMGLSVFVQALSQLGILGLIFAQDLDLHRFEIYICTKSSTEGIFYLLDAPEDQSRCLPTTACFSNYRSLVSWQKVTSCANCVSFS